GKAGAKAPDGTDWTKAKDGQKTDAGKDAGGSKDTPPGPHDISVKLQDSSGNPVPNVKWQVTLPDKSEKTGTTGDDGKISVTGLTQEGSYKLDLPDLEKGSPPPSSDSGTPAGDGGTPGAEAKGDDSSKPPK